MFTRQVRVTSFYAGDIEVQFHADSSREVPDFPYRVFIIRHSIQNGRDHEEVIARDWMGEDFRPSKKTARYYYEKHVKEAA